MTTTTSLDELIAVYSVKELIRLVRQAEQFRETGAVANDSQIRLIAVTAFRDSSTRHLLDVCNAIYRAYALACLPDETDESVHSSLPKGKPDDDDSN